MRGRRALWLAAAAVACAAGAARAQGSSAPMFTAAQADEGHQIYADRCAVCHGPHLDDGEWAPSLKGVRFKQHWGAVGAPALYGYVSRAMPPGQTSLLAPQDYDAILAFIYQANGASAGDKRLVAEPAPAQ